MMYNYHAMQANDDNGWGEDEHLTNMEEDRQRAQSTWDEMYGKTPEPTQMVTKSLDGPQPGANGPTADAETNRIVAGNPSKQYQTHPKSSMGLANTQMANYQAMRGHDRADAAARQPGKPADAGQLQQNWTQFNQDPAFRGWLQQNYQQGMDVNSAVGAYKQHLASTGQPPEGQVAGPVNLRRGALDL